MSTIKSNQSAWKQARAMIRAIQHEKEYGSKLSPYTTVLLDNLQALVNAQINLNDEGNPN